MWQCPLCSGKSVGKVGQSQFYCWDCCCEFVHDKSGYTVYIADADGTIVESNTITMKTLLNEAEP